jgi:hypothetical protein
MHARHRWWALAALMILAVLVFAACGSSDGGGGGGESAEPSAAASEGTPVDSPEPSDAEPSQDGDGGGGGDFPEVADGTFGTGTMRVEISGGHDATTDIEAAGVATAGGIFMSGASTDGATAQVVWSKAEGSGGVAYNDAEVVTAVDMVEQCELDVTKNDGSGLDGVVECKGVEALVNGGTTSTTIDLKIEFALDR